MKRTTRRLLSLLMAVVLCLGLTPVTAWAANFPSEFYASVTYKYESNTKYEIFGTVTQSADTLTYSRTGEKMDRVVYGMEYAGGVFFTVEGNKLPRNEDDGLRELRMYNSDLSSYRTIGTVNQKNDGYWIVDTAMDLSGEEPALYGTYNTVIPDVIAMTMICTIDLETAEPGDYLQVTGLPNMHIIYAMAFDKEGKLYAIGADGGADGGPATLYTIDLDNVQEGAYGSKTVAATKVEAIKDGSGKAISTNFIQDLGFDHANDILYWAENAENVLYTVDAASAAATKVGSLPTLQSFCIPYDAAFGQNNDQYMVSVICEGAGTVTSNNASSPFYMVEDNGSITLNITPDAGSGLRYVKVDGKNVSLDGLVENGYTFANVTKNHVIEVGFKLAIPATQKTVDWLHYQGEPASFYTKDNVYKFYDLPYLDKDVPREGYIQTLLDEDNNPIDNNEIILPGNYDVHVTHPGNADYAAMDVTYEDALQLAKCPGTPGRPVVYGKVGCTQGDLSTTSALQDYYDGDGELIDAAYDEIPVTLVWQNPETTYNEVGNFYASATIHAAKELDQRLKDCYNLDDEGTPLTEGCLISARNTQVIVLPADQASIIKVQASDASGGTVSGKGVYKNGETVTVTAEVNENAGYEFKGWQENGQTVSTNATYTFPAEKDRTLTALFEVDEDYRVTLQTDPQGGGTVTGGGSYEDDPHSATVKATPNQGYYFIGWYAGEEQKSTNAEYTFTVGQEGITLTAKFGVDLLARAELAKENLESALGTSVFEWSTLTQAVDAYEKAKTFVQSPPSGVENAQTRFQALTVYYSGVEELDFSNLGLNNEDLTELYLFTGVTDLNLSGNKNVTDLTNLANMTQLETLNLSGTGVTDLTSLPNRNGLKDLNLSNTGVTDLSGLNGLTALETLDLSNNKGIADLSALNGLSTLETLDISGTGVTTLDSLVPEDGSTFPGSKTLTAKNLSLDSISVLAKLVNAEGFDAGAVNKWDFTGSTLTDTEDNKADVAAIQNVLNVEIQKFIPPTIKTTPTPTPGGGGGATSYGVTVADCEHGKISAEPAKAAQGDTVTISVTPDEGYELESLAVSDAGGKAVEVSRNDDGTFSFEMPASDVTVDASFAAVEPVPWESPYSDVSEADWFYADVAAVSERGVMAGYGGTDLFGPYDGTTRAMAATVIWRLAGEPEVDYAVPFADVEEGQWYTEAVRWAASTGVAAGYGGTDLFGTDDPVTREQFATMLSRFAQAAGLAPVEPGDLSAFSDAAEVSEWGAEGMAWAVGAGIVRGVDDSHLAPQSGALRCELAAMLNRTIEGFDL